MTTYLEYFSPLGNGAFSRVVIDQVGNRIAHIELADWEGDGDLDVFIQWQLGSSDYRIHFYENLGNDQWADHVELYCCNSTAISFGLTDIDNDGDLDLIRTFVNGEGYYMMWNECLESGFSTSDQTLIFVDADNNMVLEDFRVSYFETVDMDLDGGIWTSLELALTMKM